MILSAIHARLAADAAVAAVVGETPAIVRIFPVVAPQSAAYPLVVLTAVDVRRSASLHEARDYCEGVVQVDVYARTYGEAHELEAATRRALHVQAFVAGGVTVQACRQQTTKDMTEGTEPGSATRPLFRLSTDYSVAFEEN